MTKNGFYMRNNYKGYQKKLEEHRGVRIKDEDGNFVETIAMVVMSPHASLVSQENGRNRQTSNR